MHQKGASVEAPFYCYKRSELQLLSPPKTLAAQWCLRPSSLKNSGNKD